VTVSAELAMEASISQIVALLEIETPFT